MLYAWRKREHEKRLERQEAHHEALIDLMSKAMLVSTSGLGELQVLVPQLVEQIAEQDCRVTVQLDEVVLFEVESEHAGPRLFSLELNGTTIKLGKEPSSAAISALSTLAITLSERVQEIHTALRDPHTGLYVKGHFLQALEYEFERACRYGHEVSVVLVDADLFKEHNDRYGHLSGDRALFALAAILEGHHRRYDTVARYGGEEFALLLPETAAKDAYTLAEIIRKEVETHQFEGNSNEPARLTISLGIATFPDVSRGPEELLEQADKALYASKNAGRNRTNIAVNQAAE